MAQFNNVHLYGVACQDPKVIRSDSTGEVLNISFYVLTVTSSRSYEGGNARSKELKNQILIRSGVSETAEKLAKVRMNDIVIIKGTVNTRNVPKVVTCSNCSEKFNIGSPTNDLSEKLGMITFVTPIDIDIRDTTYSDKTRSIVTMQIPDEEKDRRIREVTAEALQSIGEHREMSNEIQLLGNLCADPTQQNQGRETSYQLGVNRNFYLKDDAPDAYSDYPYVRSFGRQADSDIEHLQKGSLVLIDGCLMLRVFDRTSVCPKCGASKTWKSNAMEVVPYSVQYLQNLKKPEENTERSEI